MKKPTGRRHRGAGKSADPARQLIAAFHAAEAGKSTRTEALTLAKQHALAQTATPRTNELLAATLAPLHEQGNRRAALLFARMVVWHASCLDDLGRSALALELYAHARPVIEAHASPPELARWRIYTGIALANADRHAEAVSDYDEALPLLRTHGRPDEVALCLMNRASAIHCLERQDEAVAGFDEALPLFRRYGRPDQVARCLMNRANPLRKLGRHAEAVRDCDEALPLLRKQGRPGEVALCLSNLAHALDGVGRPAEAAAAHEAALPLLRTHGRPEAVAACLADRANLLVKLGRFAEAAAASGEALPLLRTHALPAAVAAFLLGRAVALEETGRSADAVGVSDEGLPLLRVNGKPGAVAAFLSVRANALRNLGRHAEAVDDLTEALPLLRAHGTPDELATCLTTQAISLEKLGRHAEAVAGHDEALPQLRKSGGVQLARCLSNRANALGSLGRYAESVTGHHEALPLFRTHDRPDQAAACLTNRANTLARLGRAEEAVVDYDEALPLLRAHGTPYAEALCLMNRGTALHSLGRDAEAVDDYDEALPLFRRHGAPNEVAACLSNQANALENLGRDAEAIRGRDEALVLFRSHGTPDQVAGCLMSRAYALLRLGRAAEAVAGFRELDPATFFTPDRIKFHGSFALALTDAGLPREALDQYACCRRTMRQTRLLSAIDETDLQFIPMLLDYLRGAVRGALDQSEPLLAFDTVQDGKACLFADLRGRLQKPASLDADLLDGPRQDLLRALRAGQDVEGPLRAYQHILRRSLEAGEPARGPAAFLPADASPADTLARIRSALPPRWALLDFWQLDEELAIFVVTHDDLRVIRTRPFDNSPDLVRQLELYQQFIANLCPYLGRKRRPTGWAEANVDQLWDNLHQAIFSPVLPVLDGIDGLYLVPHFIWHLAPLHAARWFDASRCEQVYLSDRFQVAYLPSAALLPDLLPLQLEGSILSLANPDRQTPATLPFAEWEAAQLKRLARPESRFHVGDEADSSRTTDWDFASLLHFSCHGAGHPRFAPLSRLALARDPLLAHDVAYRRPALRRGAMVVLNGCETAVRDHRALDEGMGLMTSFLLRGASLVLASQWSVQDHCAAEMVVNFVEQVMLQGTGPAQALQQTQRQVRGLSGEATQSRCYDLLTMFPEDEYPHEAKKICATAWRAALRSGRPDDARHHAEGLAVALRRLGDEGEALRLETALRHGRPEPPSSEDRYGEDYPHEPPGYDDPFYWAAFQLVGRIA